MVLTDFVFALAFFALYFFYLLFNCQVSIAPAFYVSLSIISPIPSLVKWFFKTFLSFFEVIFCRLFCDSFTILSLSPLFVKHLFEFSLDFCNFCLLFQNSPLQRAVFVRHLQLRLLNIGEIHEFSQKHGAEPTICIISPAPYFLRLYPKFYCTKLSAPDRMYPYATSVLP